MVLAIAIWAWTAAPAVAETWRWPVRGDVLADFANGGGPYAGGQHRGIDVGAPVGAPVVAAVAGTVRFAGLVGSSGLTVSVRSGDGRFDVSYLHMADVTVQAGHAVAAGQRIGSVGTSGRGSTSAPHLHFGVRDAGTRRYRDPLDFLPPLPGVRDMPRGAPVAVRGPLRVGPAPQHVRPHRFPVGVRGPLGVASAPAPVRPHRFPVADRRLPAGEPARAGWAIACGALIFAGAIAGGSVRRRRRRVALRRTLPSLGGR